MKLKDYYVLQYMKNQWLRYNKIHIMISVTFIVFTAIKEQQLFMCLWCQRVKVWSSGIYLNLNFIAEEVMLCKCIKCTRFF